MDPFKIHAEQNCFASCARGRGTAHRFPRPHPTTPPNSAAGYRSRSLPPRLLRQRPESPCSLASHRRIPRLRIFLRDRSHRLVGGCRTRVQRQNRACAEHQTDRPHRRGCWGRAPKAPPPWPGTGLFHGSWLELDGGPTGLRSSSSSVVAQDGMKTETRAAARIMRMPEHKKASAACKLAEAKKSEADRPISWSPGWRGSRGHRAGCGHPGQASRDRSRRSSGKVRSRRA